MGKTAAGNRCCVAAVHMSRHKEPVDTRPPLKWKVTALQLHDTRRGQRLMYDERR